MSLREVAARLEWVKDYQRKNRESEGGDDG